MASLFETTPGTPAAAHREQDRRVTSGLSGDYAAKTLPCREGRPTGHDIALARCSRAASEFAYGVFRSYFPAITGRSVITK
jgi:hypothetical protein